MREPDMEGVASHHGPVSCAGGGNVAGEASIGVRTGQLLSSEITTLGAPTELPGREGHAGCRVTRERRSGPTESKTLACAEALCSRTGRSQRFPVGLRPWGRSGKVRDRNPDVHAAGKSDIGVVPENVPNKAGSGEAVGHGGTGNPPHNRKGGDGNPPPTPKGVACLTRSRRHRRKGRWPRAPLLRRPQTGHWAGSLRRVDGVRDVNPQGFTLRPKARAV